MNTRGSNAATFRSSDDVPRGTTWEGPDDELLTVVEVASLFKVKASTVRAWAREGRLPCVRLGPRATRWTRPLLREFRDRCLDPGNSV
jgi:excisionase family DNA binding protein